MTMPKGYDNDDKDKGIKAGKIYKINNSNSRNYSNTNTNTNTNTNKGKSASSSITTILIIIGVIGFIVTTIFLIQGWMEASELEADIRNDALENPDLCTNPYLPDENKKFAGCTNVD
jgi:hypothetical protein